ncbi:hypothetical protein C2G38_2155976 [Gigaspora rosea]|uniref:Uncharacterized protein n=1 Tax=Gigaspora rosea TaxID=44941 RepID=A0A397W559_9GLOM|nr:hypothetical protein C2G38_2155976 [Gigaspora rosea]
MAEANTCEIGLPLSSYQYLLLPFWPGRVDLPGIRCHYGFSPPGTYFYNIGPFPPHHRRSLLPPYSGLAKWGSVSPVPWICLCHEAQLRPETPIRDGNQELQVIYPTDRQETVTGTQVYFSKRRQWDLNPRPATWGLSKHMSKCLNTVEDVPVFTKSAKSFRKSLLFDELPRDDINKDQLNIGYSSSSKTSKKISFKDINFSNPVQNINLESYIANLSNDDNLSKNLADMFFELKDNTYSKNFEVDPNTNILDEFENTSQDYRELSDDILVSADYFEDMRNNSSDNENQEYLTKLMLI